MNDIRKFSVSVTSTAVTALDPLDASPRVYVTRSGELSEKRTISTLFTRDEVEEVVEGWSHRRPRVMEVTELGQLVEADIELEKIEKLATAHEKASDIARAIDDLREYLEKYRCAETIKREGKGEVLPILMLAGSCHVVRDRIWEAIQSIEK